MAMRRWFARTYHQPPNSPLFDAESMSYWAAHLLADQEAEKQQLMSALAESKDRSDAVAVKWREGVRKRLAALGDTMVAVDDGNLAADLEAARRGELPDFMKRRMGKSRG